MIPDPFSVDPDTLTLGELAVIEGVCGLSLPEILVGFAENLAGTSPKFLVALIAIAGSRVDPAYSLEDAADVPLLHFYPTDGGE